MFLFCFFEVGTAVWPGEIYHGNLLLKQSGKIFCHSLFLINNFVVVDSPRFQKSLGIDPKKALLLIAVYTTGVYIRCRMYNTITVDTMSPDQHA